MRYEYCRGWNSKLWKPGEPITEEEARQRFASDDSDDWFGVAAFQDDVPNTGIPEFVLEVLPHAEFINVFFYDQSKSPRYIYGLRTTGDKLFHTSITQYTYPDDSRQYSQNECSVVEKFTFKPDGTVRQRRNDKSKPTVEVSEYQDVDVSSRWEPIPKFGQWDYVARFDR